MGFSDSQKDGGVGGRYFGGFRSLIRRKQVDSVHIRSEGHQLAKELSVLHLIAIGNSVINEFFFVSS